MGAVVIGLLAVVAGLVLLVDGLGSLGQLRELRGELGIQGYWLLLSPGLYLFLAGCVLASLGSIYEQVVKGVALLELRGAANKVPGGGAAPVERMKTCEGCNGTIPADAAMCPRCGWA